MQCPYFTTGLEGPVLQPDTPAVNNTELSSGNAIHTLRIMSLTTETAMRLIPYDEPPAVWQFHVQSGRLCYV